jgi:hypothetical protein
MPIWKTEPAYWLGNQISSRNTTNKIESWYQSKCTCGQVEYPPASSGLRYFSTLDSFFLISLSWVEKCRNSFAWLVAYRRRIFFSNDPNIKNSFYKVINSCLSWPLNGNWQEFSCWNVSTVVIKRYYEICVVFFVFF